MSFITVKEVLNKTELSKTRYHLLQAIIHSPEWCQPLPCLDHVKITSKEGKLLLRYIHHHKLVKEVDTKVHTLFKSEFEPFVFKKGPLLLLQAKRNTALEGTSPQSPFSYWHAYGNGTAWDMLGFVNLNLDEKVFYYLQDIISGALCMNVDIKHPVVIKELPSGIYRKIKVVVPPGSAIVYPASLFCQFHAEPVYFTEPDLYVHFGYGPERFGPHNHPYEAWNLPSREIPSLQPQEGVEWDYPHYVTRDCKKKKIPMRIVKVATTPFEVGDLPIEDYPPYSREELTFYGYSSFSSSSSSSSSSEIS